MPKLIVNSLNEYDNLKQYLVYDQENVINNYRKLFGEQGIRNLEKAIYIHGITDFYEIKRYYQFVGLIKYKSDTKTLMMNIFYCDNIDTYLDGFIALKDQKWRDNDLNKIGNIIQDILSDSDKSLATIVFNKLFKAPHASSNDLNISLDMVYSFLDPSHSITTVRVGVLSLLIMNDFIVNGRFIF